MSKPFAWNFEPRSVAFKLCVPGTPSRRPTLTSRFSQLHVFGIDIFLGFSGFGFCAFLLGGGRIKFVFWFLFIISRTLQKRKNTVSVAVALLNCTGLGEVVCF